MQRLLEWGQSGFLKGRSIYTLDLSSPYHYLKVPPHDGGVSDQPSQVSPSANNGLIPNTSDTFDINQRRLQGSQEWGALIDRGANGSIAGRDMKVIETTDRTIDLNGIDDHTVRNLKIVTAAGVTMSAQGPILLIAHQIADMTFGSRTILSAVQLEHFGCVVNE